MHRASDFRHRSVTLLNVPAYLVSRSIDPLEFLRATGIPASYFSDVNAFLPREACFALENRLQRMTGDGILGGRIAYRYNLAELGPWGNMVLGAGTVREALAFAIAIAQIGLLQTGFTLTPVLDGNTLSIVFKFQGRSTHAPTQHILGSAVIIRKIALLAGRPEAIEVLFARPYSSELSDLDEMMGTRIRFGARHDAVSIDLGIVDNPLTHKPEIVRRHVQTARDVTSHIRTMLPYRRVTKDYVAFLLDTSPRTMQRRLSEWGLSFEQLIDDVRRTEAIRLVDEGRLTVTDIAAQVGYSDAPHFMRAFRRWTGQTPTAFRTFARMDQRALSAAAPE